MSTNFMELVPYLLAKKKAKKNNTKLPNEALLGLLPNSNRMLKNYLITDLATKKAIAKKEKDDSVAMLNEIVNKRVSALNGVAAGDPLIAETKAFTPKLRQLIGGRMNAGAIRDDILK